MIQASEAFKEALAAWAQKNDVSMADVIRRSVAAHIGYDLAAEPATRRGGRIYATEAERKEAQKVREKQRREINKAIMAALKNNDTEKLAELRNALLGTTTEDEPTEEPTDDEEPTEEPTE